MRRVGSAQGRPPTYGGRFLVAAETRRLIDAGKNAVSGAAGDAGVEDCPGGLVILNAVAEALNRSSDVREALDRTLELVAGFLGLRTGWVWLLDPETDQFYLAASRNLPPFLQEPGRLS